MIGMGEGIRGKLRAAAEEHAFVRVARGIPGADDIDGFVVRSKSGWTLIAEYRDMIFDGFHAVRTADVRKVKRRGRSDPAVRWLRLHGLWPPVGPRGRVRLRDARAVIESAAECYGVVGLHEESVDPEVLYVGAPVGYRTRSFGVLEVDTKARWARGPRKYRFEDVTRVTFGDRYTCVLGELAGPVPGAFSSGR
jgi:hypothetical protein